MEVINNANHADHADHADHASIVSSQDLEASQNTSEDRDDSQNISQDREDSRNTSQDREDSQNTPQDREDGQNTPVEANREQPPAVPKVATKVEPSSPRDQDWKGWKLHWLTMGIMVLMEGGLIAAIVYLTIRSKTQNGITIVPQATALISSNFPVSKIWKYGLLWTTLPSLVMTGYKLVWDTFVSATANRQPFVELKKTSGASAKKTILLDYRSYFSLIAWTKALSNGHVLLGCAMFLGQVFSIAVIPLTAHLFVAAPSQSASIMALSFPTAYNEFGLENTTSLQPAIDLASASLVYNATPPPWMTLQYAFESFDLGAETELTGNITANTSAYSVTLDCKTYSPSDSGATYQTDSGGTSVSYSMNDRGCDISGFIEIFSATPTYAMSWTTPCNNSDHGRIGIFAGIYSDNSSIKIDPASYSLVSCMVNYWNMSGTISMALQPNRTPRFLSFGATRNVSMYPFLHGILEGDFKNYKFFDPSNSIQADAFGYSVYSYARTQNPTSPITPDLIKGSIEDMFQTLYAGMVTQVALPQIKPTRLSNGEFSVAVTRLYVVTPIAWAIVAILALVLVFNMLLLIYAQREASILLEEPTGILGVAALLYPDDGVARFVQQFRDDHPAEEKLRDCVEKDYTVKDSTCRIDEQRRIQIEHLDILQKKPRTCNVQQRNKTAGRNVKIEPTWVSEERAVHS